jgi:heme exporter protein A
MIVARSVSKRFGYRLVLEAVDLHVRPGELVALLGPNGAGKSTLLRILATLTRPTYGEVTVASFHLPQQASAARAQLGFVSHRPLLYEDLSAAQNLGFYAQLYGIQRPESRVKDLLRTFDLDSRRNEPVRSFSRGLQQRLALARGVLHRPKVLLLDEPHTGLDRESVAVLDELLREQAKHGTAILMATHNLLHAQRLARRVLVLAGGRLEDPWGRRRMSAAQFAAHYDRALRRAQARGEHG